MASTFRRKYVAAGSSSSSDSSTSGVVASSSSPVVAAATVHSSSGMILPGCKAWTAGTVLVSTGLRELDNQLAATTGNTGGQPLGTCIYLEEDRLGNNLASCIVRYWCAEALSQGQSLLLPIAATCESCQSRSNFCAPSPVWGDEKSSGSLSIATDKDISSLLGSLPRNLHKDKQEQQQNATQSTANQQLDSLTEEIDEDDAEDGLVVAWQYRKDVQRERLGLSNNKASTIKAGRSGGSAVYCHSFDLQGRLADQMDVYQAATVVSIGCCSQCCLETSHSRQSCGLQYYTQLIQQVEQMLTDQPRKVVRVLLYHPETTCLAVALPLVLEHICHSKLPVVVMVAVQPWTISSNQSLRHLQRSSDVVLEVESFVGRQTYPPPPEFRHLHGLLRIRKAATCNLVTAVGHFCHLTVQKRPVASLFGLKRDRRKLHLQLLHIPPEDYAADGGSVGSGVRSGAGRSSRQATLGCSSSGGGSDTLDF